MRIAAIVCAGLLLSGGRALGVNLAWNRVDQGLPASANLQDVVADPVNLGTIFGIGQAADLWRTQDDGDNWALLGPPVGDISVLAIDPVESNYLYVSDGGSLWRSPDRGESWARVALPPGETVRDLAVLRMDDRQLILATETGLYRSNDRGDSWQAATSTPDNYGSVVGIGALDNNVLVAFRAGATWQSLDRGLTWEDTGFPAGKTIVNLSVGQWSDMAVLTSDGDVYQWNPRIGWERFFPASAPGGAALLSITGSINESTEYYVVTASATRINAGTEALDPPFEGGITAISSHTMMPFPTYVLLDDGAIWKATLFRPRCDRDRCSASILLPETPGFSVSRYRIPRDKEGGAFRASMSRAGGAAMSSFHVAGTLLGEQASYQYVGFAVQRGGPLSISLVVKPGLADSARIRLVRHFNGDTSVALDQTISGSSGLTTGDLDPGFYVINFLRGGQAGHPRFRAAVDAPVRRGLFIGGAMDSGGEGMWFAFPGSGAFRTGYEFGSRLGEQGAAAVDLSINHFSPGRGRRGVLPFEPAAPPASGVLERISLSTEGNQGGGGCPAINGDGTRVALQSTSRSYALRAKRGGPQVFLRDTDQGTTQWVSRVTPPRFTAPNDMNFNSSQAMDNAGRYLVYRSTSEHIVPDETPGVYLYDTRTELNRLILPTSRATSPIISGNGQWIFVNAVGHDGELLRISRTTGEKTVLRRDVAVFGMSANDDGSRLALAMDVSVSAPPIPVLPVRGVLDVDSGDFEYLPESDWKAFTDNTHLVISSNGRYVAFAGRLPGPGEEMPGAVQIYRFDLESGNMEIVSRGADGRPLAYDSDWPAISYDGSRVAFFTVEQLVDRPSGGRGGWNLYWRDLTTNAVRRIATEVDLSGRGCRPVVMDQAGDTLVFETDAPDFVPFDSTLRDIFRLDLDVPGR